MKELEQLHLACPEPLQELDEFDPIVYEDGDRRILQFRTGEVQSQMSVCNPNLLMLSYTYRMMAFRRFHEEPEYLAMIGLGGGSMLKWCYHRIPNARITVVEINPKVISLREQFLIPPDDDRLRVLCGDGARYVSATRGALDVLLVDGFDLHGQPPRLCSQAFYDDCYHALRSEGVLAVNICDSTYPLIDRIRASFAGQVVVDDPQDGGNTVVFAIKGGR